MIIILFTFDRNQNDKVTVSAGYVQTILSI